MSYGIKKKGKTLFPSVKHFWKISLSYFIAKHIWISHTLYTRRRESKSTELKFLLKFVTNLNGYKLTKTFNRPFLQCDKYLWSVISYTFNILYINNHYIEIISSGKINQFIIIILIINYISITIISPSVLAIFVYVP